MRFFRSLLMQAGYEVLRSMCSYKESVKLSGPSAWADMMRDRLDFDLEISGHLALQMPHCLLASTCWSVSIANIFEMVPPRGLGSIIILSKRLPTAREAIRD